MTLPTQPSLYLSLEQLPPRARKSDPATSKEAAEHMRESGKLGEQATLVLDLVADHPNRTAYEIAYEIYGHRLDRYQIARRLADLEHLGKVVKAEPRTCRVTGRRAHTWRIA